LQQIHRKAHKNEVITSRLEQDYRRRIQVVFVKLFSNSIIP